MNRISQAIDLLTARGLSDEQISSLEAASVLDADDHFVYQTVQSRAVAAGDLTTDEAQVVYQALGGVFTPSNGGWSQGTDAYTKVVCMKVIAELSRAR